MIELIVRFNARDDASEKMVGIYMHRERERIQEDVRYMHRERERECIRESQ